MLNCLFGSSDSTLWSHTGPVRTQTRTIELSEQTLALSFTDRHRVDYIRCILLGGH